MVFRAQPGWSASGRLKETNRRTLAILLVAFSALATTAGLYALVAFDNTPGTASSAPETWPRTTSLPRPDAAPDVLVFAHPFCSCTTATVAELATLVTSLPHGAMPRITFVVYRPDPNTGWSWNTLKHSASALPGSRFVWDDGGREARRFGAMTSGMVLAYSASGALEFQGGITGSRGHVGDNFGLDALRIALKTTTPTGQAGAPGRAIPRSRVFGCALGSFETEQASAESPLHTITDRIAGLATNLGRVLHRNTEEKRL